MIKSYCLVIFSIIFPIEVIAQLALPPDQEFVYLGEHGELIAPLPNSPRPSTSALAVVRGKSSIQLYDVVGLALVATVSEDGEIRMSKETPKGIRDLSQFPTRLDKRKMQDGQFPAPGTVVAREMQEGEKNIPNGMFGWVVQIGSGGIFMPLQDSQKPVDFLWILVTSKGEFSLVHSGPNYDGEFISVNKDYLISFGKSAQRFREVDSKPKYWPYRFRENGQEVPLSVGAGVSIRGEDSSESVIFYRDGMPSAITTELVRE